MGVNALSERAEPGPGLLPRPDGSRAYEFHQHASRLFHLTLTWRRRCGNDSDAVFVYMAFLLAAATEAVNEVSNAGVVSLAEVQASLSAFSIANMTGIPRETVRRKLRLLEQNGVIAAGPGASYTLRLERSRLLEALQPRGLRPGGGAS